MWTMSAAAGKLLSASHTMVSQVLVLQSGAPVYALDVVSGNVSTDNTRAVLRNLGCTLIDPTGALSGSDADDLLNPYDCEIQPWRGVRLSPGAVFSSAAVEMAPLGVFRLTTRQVSGNGEIEIDGQDRTINYQGPMANALGISGGTPVEDAIAELLATRNPGLSMLTVVTGYTVGPLVYAPDIDVWGEAVKLAASVGGVLYHDRLGQLVFRLAGPTTATPAFTWAEGDGLLLSVQRREDSDTIANVVIAENHDGSIRAVVADENPASPTYAGGRYGVHPVTITGPYSSTSQAQAAAAAKLAYELGRSETVTISAVPDPRLDPDDVVVLNRPAADLNNRNVLTSSITLPLTATDAMSVGFRKSVLTPDGRNLQAVS